MEIIVNGEQKTTDAASVLLFLESLEIDPRRVAVEHNLEILPKSDYATTMLKDGDHLEIVQFVGGGNGGRVENSFGLRPKGRNPARSSFSTT